MRKLVVVGQGKSDEIPPLILWMGFALKIYLDDAPHNVFYLKKEINVPWGPPAITTIKGTKI